MKLHRAIHFFGFRWRLGRGHPPTPEQFGFDFHVAFMEILQNDILFSPLTENPGTATVWIPIVFESAAVGVGDARVLAFKFCG